MMAADYTPLQPPREAESDKAMATTYITSERREQILKAYNNLYDLNYYESQQDQDDQIAFLRSLDNVAFVEEIEHCTVHAGIEIDSLDHLIEVYG